MERKKLSELTLVKVQNCMLNVALLNVQMEKVLTIRNQLLADELKALGCEGNWTLDEQTWEFVKVEGKA